MAASNVGKNSKSKSKGVVEKIDNIRNRFKRQRKLLIGRGQDSGGKFQAACLSSDGKLGLTVREEDSNFQVYNMEVAGDRNVGDLITNVELDYEWGKFLGRPFRLTADVFF